MGVTGSNHHYHEHDLNMDSPEPIQGTVGFETEQDVLPSSFFQEAFTAMEWQFDAQAWFATIDNPQDASNSSDEHPHGISVLPVHQEDQYKESIFGSTAVHPSEQATPSDFSDLCCIEPDVTEEQLSHGTLSNTTSMVDYESFPHPNEPGTVSKKRNHRFTLKVKTTLKEYYAHTPYPTAVQITVLALSSGETFDRISTWFANTRARQKDPDQPNLATRLSKDSLKRLSREYDSIPVIALPDQKPPMDAWMASAPVPVTSDDIATTILSTRSSPCALEGGQSRPPSKTFSRASSSNGSIGTMNSGNSGKSSSSAGSRASSYCSGRRQGRKRVSAGKPYPTASERESIDRRWICTFCEKRFKDHYEWARHELIHAPQAAWICGPQAHEQTFRCLPCDGSKNVEQNGVHSSFDLFANENPIHNLQGHGFDSCWAKPVEKRTFYRKDQFRTHIHNSHLHKSKHPSPLYGCDPDASYGCNAFVQSCKHTATSLASTDHVPRCGFCGTCFRSWKDRTDHVSKHFKNEKHLNLSKWWPDRELCNLQFEYPTSNLDECCPYCSREFRGKDDHRVCTLYSCRFLDDIGTLEYLSCVSDRLRANYRNCTQEIYTSPDIFGLHIRNDHDVHFGISTGSSFVEHYSKSFPARVEGSKKLAIENDFPTQTPPLPNLQRLPQQPILGTTRPFLPHLRIFRAGEVLSPDVYLLKENADPSWVKVLRKILGLEELHSLHISALVTSSFIPALVTIGAVPGIRSAEIGTAMIEYGW